jgi:hypothetical protein
MLRNVLATRPTIALCAALFGTAATLSLAHAVRADVQAATGRLVGLLVIEPTSTQYAQYHGSITVGDSIGGFATYHWGGSFCPGKDLPEASVASLQRALDNPRVVVQPFTLNGQGGALCVVGVRYILRSEQGLFP